MKDWIEVLRQEVAARSQGRVAAELGVSKTMISQVLNDKYPADPADLRCKVEGRYMKRTVECPVLGTIPVHECEAHQKRPFGAGNEVRVRLYRACRAGCPHSKLEATAKTQRIKVQQADNGPQPYNADNQLGFCKRMAAGDSEKHIAMLERELTKLATQYNLLLWQLQHKEQRS
jgi:hypothetical protein